MPLYKIKDEPIEIVSKACPECLFTPEKILSSTQRQDMIETMLRDGTFPQCHYVQIAEREGKPTPAYACCFAYFYRYWHQIPLLRELVERQRVQYFDLPPDWKGLRESGLQLYGNPCWHYDDAPTGRELVEVPPPTAVRRSRLLQETYE